jgi:hypothetical protein
MNPLIQRFNLLRININLSKRKKNQKKIGLYKRKNLDKILLIIIVIVIKI